MTAAAVAAGTFPAVCLLAGVLVRLARGGRILP